MIHDFLRSIYPFRRHSNLAANETQLVPDGRIYCPVLLLPFATVLHPSVVIIQSSLLEVHLQLKYEDSPDQRRSRNCNVALGIRFAVVVAYTIRAVRCTSAPILTTAIPTLVTARNQGNIPPLDEEGANNQSCSCLCNPATSHNSPHHLPPSCTPESSSSCSGSSSTSSSSSNAVLVRV